MRNGFASVRPRLRITIAGKLYAGFGSLILVLAATVLITARGINGINADIDRLAGVNEPLSSAAYEMEIAMIGMGQSVLQFRATGEPEAQARFERAAYDFERYNAVYDNLATNAEARRLGAEIDASYAEYLSLGRNLITANETGSAPVTPELRRFNGLRADMAAVLDDGIQQMARRELAATQSGADAAVSGTATALLAMLLTGAVAGAAAAVIISRGIIRPVRRLAEGAERLERGDLDHRITVDTHDEIGELGLAFNRMAAERQQSEGAARHMAYHDALTGLPNRRLLQDRFNLAVARARRRNEQLAVISIDLDRFKLVNDTYGHLAGDHLLRTVARRLVAATRDTDTVARIGGDEFMLVLPEADSSGVARIAGRILDSMKSPVKFEGREFHATASLGVSIYPEDGQNCESLIKVADAAMYAAKRQEQPATTTLGL